MIRQPVARRGCRKLERAAQPVNDQQIVSLVGEIEREIANAMGEITRLQDDLRTAQARHETAAILRSCVDLTFSTNRLQKLEAGHADMLARLLKNSVGRTLVVVRAAGEG